MHTAPAHGVDDYIVGQKYGLPVDNPVGDNGRFFENVPLVGGLLVWKANEVVIQELEKNGLLLKQEKLLHSYPTAGGTRLRSFSARRPNGLFPWTRESEIRIEWIKRSKQAGWPDQTNETLREAASAAVEATAFYPSWGRARLGRHGEKPAGLVHFAPAELGSAHGALCKQANP